MRERSGYMGAEIFLHFAKLQKNFKHMKITGKELIAIGFEQGKAIGMALRSLPTDANESTLDTLKAILAAPEAYLTHDRFNELAQELATQKQRKQPITLREEALDYQIYGKKGIEGGALQQIETAMRLPVAKAGALMPDGHQGYGLPIGGVLATENAIIPYAVGVDIGCRMCMTIYDIPATALSERKEDFKEMLLQNTRFGFNHFDNPKDHAVLEHPLFNQIPIVKRLKGRAYKQIGTSGGGNHFVEFGITEIIDPDNEFGLKPGQYLALLSHSGSRGLGANIARHYTKLAMDRCKLPKEAKHLAWLDLDTEEGQEYWLAMNLAGDYASACHHQIHERMAESLKTQPLTLIENHHNFAWKEKDADGNDIIVHRKGATPAGKGVLGIIPGSMTAPGFIVRGKGNPASINSAAHGAGRAMSRRTAIKTLDEQQVKKHLQDNGVELIGAGLDEAPMAYKDIRAVMDHQKDLVEVVGSFLPKIVRMED